MQSNTHSGSCEFFGLPLETYEAFAMASAWFSERYERLCTTRLAHVAFPAPNSAQHVEEDRKGAARALLVASVAMSPVMAEDPSWTRKHLCREFLARARRVRSGLGMRPAHFPKGGVL